MTASVLSISKVEATMLLFHFRWDVTKANEEFFADQDRIRNSLGLLNKQLLDIDAASPNSCGICFDCYPNDKVRVLSCGHLFCNSCWRFYIETSISNGPSCLMLKCPARPCGVVVGQDMVEKLVLRNPRRNTVII